MKLRTEAEIDAELARDHAAEIERARRFCAVLWAFVFAFAVAAQVLDDGRGMVMTFVAAIVTSIITVATCKLARDERLVRPVIYRATAWVVLATTLLGVSLAVVPHASDASQLGGVYFGLVAFFGYRCVVTRGSRAALWTLVIAMWSWLPFAFLALVGCGCRRYERVPHWTEVVSMQSLRGLLLLLPLLAIAALVSFSPRRDFVPDARVIRAAGR